MQYTVKLKQVLVDWNCAYAVYGQVETSFWLTEIALVLNEESETAEMTAQNRLLKLWM